MLGRTCVASMQAQNLPAQPVTRNDAECVPEVTRRWQPDGGVELNPTPAFRSVADSTSIRRAVHKLTIRR